MKPKTPAEARWKFLNEDLLEAFRNPKLNDHTIAPIVRINVRGIVFHLYQTPIKYVGRRYTFDKKFERIIDLYYLTEREIIMFGHSHHLDCAEKTIQRFNDILDSEGLPPIRDVTR